MAELSPEEVESFRKWQLNKSTRKVKSTSKRKALTALKDAHKAEYTKLVIQFGGTVKA